MRVQYAQKSTMLLNKNEFFRLYNQNKWHARNIQTATVHVAEIEHSEANGLRLSRGAVAFLLHFRWFREPSILRSTYN